jgi:hypothetical protein
LAVGSGVGRVDKLNARHGDFLLKSGGIAEGTKIWKLLVDLAWQ